MASYQIGDVERLLQLRSHVLRYWEKEIPLLQVKKDLGGRRVYSARDIRILLRLKHLVYERHFTLEGAYEQLLKELSDSRQNMRAELDALRSDLLAVYDIVRTWTDAATEDTNEPVSST
ncbi:MAG: MerR family transcriptional regulator [Termitinemataceae bacterium]